MSFVPHWPLASWQDRWPGLLAGITHSGGPEQNFDLRVIGATSPGGAERWLAFRDWSGFPSVVHAPQVHGTKVLRHTSALPGWVLTPQADGHVTGTGGVLLTVSVADCVPVYLYDPSANLVGLLHAGRKGVAHQILQAGLQGLEDLGGRREKVVVHVGPSICGDCYEVGPEVHVELGLPEPEGSEPVDLRAMLREQASGLGISGERFSASNRCTRCPPQAGLFSHRRGHSGRQVAYIGLGAGSPGATLAP